MKLLTNINRGIHSAGFHIKKHSPEILMITGVIGVVGSTVLACKATLKVNEILEESEDTINKIHEAEDKYADSEEVNYSSKDAKRDLTIAYAKTGVKLVKLYAPAITLGVLSLGSIVASNDILRKRNAALAAAYVTLDKGFKEYRARVVERFGQDVDNQLRYGIKAEKIESIDENGKKTKETVKMIDGDGFSDFAVFFGKATSRYYEGINDYDSIFLNGQESYANDLLMVKGDVTLREIYDGLDIKKECIPEEQYAAAMVVGWRYDKNNVDGDNRIIFFKEPATRRLEDGTIEEGYIIDFNVDGNIYNKIVKK